MQPEAAEHQPQAATEAAPLAAEAATGQQDASSSGPCPTDAPPSGVAGSEAADKVPPPDPNDPAVQMRINNLSKWATVKDVKHLLERRLGLTGVRKVRKISNQDYAFVYFQSAQERLAADSGINGHKWKGSVLSTAQAKPLDPDRHLKREREGGEGQGGKRVCAQQAGGRGRGGSGEAGEAGGAAAARTAADAAAPLHRLEYAAQLEQKQHFVEKALRRLPREMQAAAHRVAARSDTQRERWRMPWLSQERLNQRHGLPCPVAPVLPAAATHGYRNKCEFTLGRDEDGSVAVGFTLGTVASELARLREAFVAPLDPPVRLSLAVRRGAPPGEYKHAGEPAEAGGLETAEGVETVLGREYIEETLLGLSFRISPDAFFQVNTLGAESLLTLLRAQCSLGPDSVLLDVCCGTGTIGLAMARSVKRVIGIESNAQAVADAAANAARNGITNAEFICAKAEQATRQVLERLTPSELDSLVAIVDPPRAGLHPDVVKALRRCAPLRRLLFVACHAPAFVTNAVSFCRPTSPSFAGVPFELVQAWPIDLFPHTPHCELVTLLERSDLVAEREAAQEAAQAAKQAQAVQTQAAEAASTPTDAAEGGAVSVWG
ncbi:hypothetical protein EMIHUDRAFT_471521 [Emiliania huxleyi CCMP1516]|uniref:Uncharacterized protein n=2 Tax=Emiliania huxleyi TaxID=2903 RepID=A0A0D3KMV8_EMIH1|nr:hypothetical protein EMIHUDRAFT_471521 [Emiliania huxleyi CCMP1516]EOD37093.1 hypothetical protein EMIHUDRAFT_471521 [Emiliania huxleyi CCMP1516]|eukprot:XP_005789522.1 hypothetical protein EMIHUDRAFT_471521 [Emiliania huxleyi CCMP1516]